MSYTQDIQVFVFLNILVIYQIYYDIMMSISTWDRVHIF